MSTQLSRLLQAVGLPGATAVVIIVIWETASRLGWVPHFVLPAPSEIAGECIKSWRNLALHAYVTTIEVVLGFIAAVLAGVSLAVVMVYVRLIERAIYPWVVVLQVIPKVALGP